MQTELILAGSAAAVVAGAVPGPSHSCTIPFFLEDADSPERLCLHELVFWISHENRLHHYVRELLGVPRPD